jgi:acetyl-CoA acyltransferase
VPEAFIVDAVRTPLGRGKLGGGLSGVHPADLLATTLEALVSRTGADPATFDDVIAGCVGQAGEQANNIARSAALGAGFPESVPATTVDRQCGSSQQALHFAAQGVMAGAYDAVIACGVESMSHVPIGSHTLGKDTHGRRFARRYAPGLVQQGISAELLAARWGFSRGQLDELALRSHSLAAAAADNGRFANEITQVGLSEGELAADEGIRRDTTAERLAALQPAFREDKIGERFPEIGWVVTAGNASQLTDGAAALLVCSADYATRHQLRLRARVHTLALAADDPLLMLSAIVPATRRALDRSGLRLQDIDLFEVNEAFASPVLVWQKELGANMERVNVHGGAIALGHPLGASGARLMTTLLNAMEQRGARYGLQTMCEGGGQANATIIELLNN